MAIAPQVLNHFLTRLARQALIENHKVEHRISLQEPDGLVAVTRSRHSREEPRGREGVHEERDIAVVVVTDEYSTGHESMSPVEV
jgi:hypothetical protein